MLRHMSPRHTQVWLRSTNPNTKVIREKLLHQIAILRAARANTTPQGVLLDSYDDETFIDHVQTRVAHQGVTAKYTQDTPHDLQLRAILEEDELRVRSAMCFSWIDLA